jgi:hypothetical protein
MFVIKQTNSTQFLVKVTFEMEMNKATKYYELGLELI